MTTRRNKLITNFRQLRLRRDDEYDLCNHNVCISQCDRFQCVLQIPDKVVYYGQLVRCLNIQQPKQQLARERVAMRRRVKPIKLFKYDDIEPVIPPQVRVAPTLVLDLDRTLLYTTTTKQATKCHQIKYADGTFTSYRDHVQEFLQFADEYFEIVFWSAGVQDYVYERVAYLSSFLKQKPHVLTRADCVELNQIYIKDLRKLGRNLQNVALVDDSYMSCTFQFRNCVPLRPFVGQRDNELLELHVLLKKLLEYSTLAYGIERQSRQQ